jgi:Tol biopolymer transport system component
VHTPGWDASPDGSHIVYQVVVPVLTPTGGIVSAKIYYASADGSGATQIAHALVTNEMSKLQISPDGQWVAFTNALPSPATLTASVSSPGGSGDSTFHGYSPDTYNYPVWKWDSSQFWAGKVDAADGTSTTGALYRFNRGGSSTVGVAGGYNPWYTIGS